MKLFLSIMTVFGLSTMAYSAETTIEIDQTIVDHNSNSFKQGEADAVKTVTMKGYDPNMQVKINHGEWHFYFFPHTQFTAGDSNRDGVTLDESEALKGGYDVTKDLEAGLWIGMASSKKDDSYESSTTSFGFYGLYEVSLSGAILEAELGYRMISLSDKNPNFDLSTVGGTGTGEYKGETKGSQMNLDIEYIRHIGGAWHYVGGINYQAIDVETTPKVAGTEGDKIKTKNTDMRLKLIGFRFAF